MVTKNDDSASRKDKRPSHNCIGSLGEQLAAVRLSLYLGWRRGTSAADQWDDATRLAIPRKWRDR